MGYAIRNDGQGWRAVTGPDDCTQHETWSDTVPQLTSQAAIPTSVSMRQCRLALLAANLLEQTETIIQGQAKAVQIAWQFATYVERSNPLISSIGQALELSDTEVDALFVQAAQL